MSDEKKKFRKAAEAIDINLGGLLGSLGDALGEAVQKLADLGDKVEEHSSEHGQIKVHTGLRVRTAGGVKSAPQPVNRTRAKPAAPAPRALVCELVEDGAAWFLTAEMPGVAPEEVALTVKGARLTITTTGGRSFHGAVDLPAPCPADSIALSLVNGILTLRGGAA